MMEICTKLHFWPISSHIFDRRVLRHVRSRFVMFDYTPATKYNRVDMYCLTSQLGREPHTGRTVFPHFFPKEIPEFRSGKIREKSFRNLTDIGTEIWEIFYTNPALLGWLRCWLEIGIIYRDALSKNHIFWCLRDKPDLGHELLCPLTMCKSILHKVNLACESFGACICFTIWHKYISRFILEIQNCSAMISKFDSWWKSSFAPQWKSRWVQQSKSRFAPRWTGSRFVEMDKERVGDDLGWIDIMMTITITIASISIIIIIIIT